MERILEQQAVQPERKSVRRRVGVVLEMQDSKTAEPLGRVMDLTENGFMLLTKQKLNPNAQHQLVLNLPEAIKSHRSIDLVGECRWCQPSNTQGYFGAGFSLVSVNVMQREAWSQFVEEF